MNAIGKAVKITGERLQGTPAFPVAKRAHRNVMLPKNYVEVAASEVINSRQWLKGYLSSDNGGTTLHDLDLKAVEREGDDINWKSGWHTCRDVVRFSPDFLQPDIVHPHPSSNHFCFYEYRGKDYKWHIGVTTSHNLLGPYVDHQFPILSPSGKDGCPAEDGIADPSVLYFEDREPSWHMWFDMLDSEDVWRIGHATSTNGFDWQIQRNEQNEPATVIDIGKEGEWDDQFVHAPEAFLYEDEVRLIYNAQGSGHKNYDGGVAVASDPEGIGRDFEKIGQTTAGDTALGGDDIRIKRPIKIGGELFALHSRDVKNHATICKSDDGCETWDIVSEFPHANGTSFMLKSDYLVCIASDGNMYAKKILV